MIVWNDLREWLSQAEKLGELKTIDGADPHLEVGTMAQINSRNEGPALLFDKLKGYKEGLRILTNVMSNPRLLNLTIGLPPENSIQETVEALQCRPREWEERASDYQVQLVETGPILQNVKEGDDIDLNLFPVPLWHELDGGRYIGTALGVITRDPDTGDCNMGAYRGQLFDGRSVGLLLRVF